MGRSSTGACSTDGSIRIELSYLLKEGLLRKCCKIETFLSWTGGAKIGLTTIYTRDKKYIQLSYTVTTRAGSKTDYDYKIHLTSVPSNLGKGDVLYFVCPVSGKRCRILYMAYDYPKFKSREAYNNRLYYNCQRQPKYDYWLTRMHDTKAKLKKLEEAPTKRTYQGKPTRHQNRIDELRIKLNYYTAKSDRIFVLRLTNWGYSLF